MKKVERKPISARIRRDAYDRLKSMVGHFTPKAKNTVEASSGKIIEILLLREDAQDYVEKKLFLE